LLNIIIQYIGDVKGKEWIKLLMIKVLNIGFLYLINGNFMLLLRIMLICIKEHILWKIHPLN